MIKPIFIVLLLCLVRANQNFLELETQVNPLNFTKCESYEDPEPHGNCTQ